jgi:hypothetical protein
MLRRRNFLRPATHNQVDLIPDEHTHYQVDLTSTAKMVRLSGLPDSQWLAFVYLLSNFIVFC